MKTCGVLALQGDFAAHCEALKRVGARPLEVRSVDEFKQCAGLIIPGGESTTMLKLMEFEGLTDALKEFAKQKPIYGTCAGVILLAKDVSNPHQPSLGVLDITVERNAYGRQLDSRVARVKLADKDLGGDDMEAVFIRAPIIRRTGPGVKALASYQGDPVWIEQGRHVATTFHPELTLDQQNYLPVHRRFVNSL